MTIGGWTFFVLCALCFIGAGIFAFVVCETVAGKASGLVAGIISTVLLLMVMLWFYGNTASGQRAIVDEKSDLGNGLQRTVTVYTANGDVIAQYSGQIDIEGNDGGYVLFDFEGKRYTYYNCFVESIATIE